jgi:glycosyltransferase involved in cell wall biosynthesis
MERLRVAIVIPAFNEAETIGDVVLGAIAFGQPLVVDDGSHDLTGERARSSGAFVVALPRNLGYDGALNAGFAEAARQRFEYVITMDADGQHSSGNIKTIVDALQGGADVVLGVRQTRPRLAEHLFAFATNQRWQIRDPLCGMKGYRMSVYNQLGHFDSYNSIGTELALYAARANLSITQVPVKTRDRRDAPRFGNILSANIRIFRAMFRGMLSRQ